MESKRFNYPWELCEFVNDRGIKKENIVTITYDGYFYTIFYFE